jgi:hypothetical protein
VENSYPRVLVQLADLLEPIILEDIKMLDNEKRYMVKAQCADNDQWIEGFYFRHIKRQICPIGDELKDDDIVHVICISSFADWNMPRNMQAVQIKPETIEPLALRVLEDSCAIGCPNCSRSLDYIDNQTENPIEYCPWCGQRLDWSEISNE